MALLPARPEATLGGAEFFTQAMRRAAQVGEAGRLQAELYGLLAREAERFAMGDSSLPAETAQALFHCLRFTLGVRLKPAGLEEAARLLQARSMRDLLREGREAVKALVNEAHALYAALTALPFSTANRAYRDTVLTALPEFFGKYDVLQAAQEIPCSIDYPLAWPVEGLEGAEYIREYIARLLAEIRFLLPFRPGAVRRLLRGYCPDPDEQLINLFEPVFCNALGRLLLGKDPLPLDMPAQAQRLLLERLAALNAQARAETVRAAVQRLPQALKLPPDDEVLLACLYRAGEALLPHIEVCLAQNLPGPFTAFPAKQPRPSVRMRERKPMPDEALRALIGEMQACRFLSDKLAMLRQDVHTLSDWLEIVPLCFAGEEYGAVYALLTPEELAAVARRIQSEREGVPGGVLEEWEEAFACFLAGLDKETTERLRALLRAEWE